MTPANNNLPVLRIVEAVTAFEAGKTYAQRFTCNSQQFAPVKRLVSL